MRPHARSTIRPQPALRGRYSCTPTSTASCCSQSPHHADYPHPAVRHRSRRLITSRSGKESVARSSQNRYIQLPARVWCQRSLAARPLHLCHTFSRCCRLGRVMNSCDWRFVETHAHLQYYEARPGCSRISRWSRPRPTEMNFCSGDAAFSVFVVAAERRRTESLSVDSAVSTVCAGPSGARENSNVACPRALRA